MSPRREGWEELVIRVFCLVELRILFHVRLLDLDTPD